MSIFDRFKKNKKEPEKKTAKKTAEKELRPKAEKRDLDEISQRPAEPVRQIEKKQSSDAYKILESPRVTEKSGMLAVSNSYVFNVNVDTNKHQIKKAVQDLYGVAVERVNIINVPRKSRRVGKSQGFRPGYKKAMVKLSEGEKIEIMSR
jgi:large subunit ribosomal protein L23